MKQRKRSGDGKTATDILEEAIYLLRSRPLLLAPYFIGSLPFVLVLLYFWTHMSNASNAWKHLAQAAWGPVLLFVWMKTWQGLYSRRLLAEIRGESSPPGGIRSFARTAAMQTIIQPWAFLLLPLAFLIMLPFPRIMAFFHNATLLASDDEKDLGAVIRKSWRQAGLLPKQNMLVIWFSSPFLLIIAALILFAIVPFMASLVPGISESQLLFIAALSLIPFCPLGVVTALNIGFIILTVPWLMKVLFDLETIFTINGGSIANDTFLAIVCAVAYLFLDPLIKACYVLRCFYGDSLRTGEDLRIELRTSAAVKTLLAIIAVFLLTLGPSMATAANSPQTFHPPAYSAGAVGAEDLNGSIDDVINRPEYTWRMPREKPPEKATKVGFFQKIVESIVNALGTAWRYVKEGIAKAWEYVVELLLKLMPVPKAGKADATNWASVSRSLIIILLICVAALLVFLVWRALRERTPAKAAVPVVPVPLPDISADDVDAAELPEEGWLKMARDLKEKKELRLALRALYLASLAFLARLDLIVTAKYKSNGEYEKELRRRCVRQPLLVGTFAENRTIFEEAWYGSREVTDAAMEHFLENQEVIRANAQK